MLSLCCYHQKARKSRQNGFRDKTAYVWALDIDRYHLPSNIGFCRWDEIASLHFTMNYLVVCNKQRNCLLRQNTDVNIWQRGMRDGLILPPVRKADVAKSLRKLPPWLDGGHCTAQQCWRQGSRKMGSKPRYIWKRLLHNFGDTLLSLRVLAPLFK